MKYNKSTIIWCAVAFIVCLLFAGGCSTYNTMVSAEETVDRAWGDVQASYQRRFDLIPNLVNTVKGYAAHESQTFEKVTNARAGVIQLGDSLIAKRNGLNSFSPDGNGPSIEQYEQLNNGVDALKDRLQIYVNAVHEAYPDLKANENFKGLQDELTGTENRINFERNRYNEAVRDYNIKIRTFPSSIFAGMFGFERKNQFAATAGAQSAPTVDFN